MGSFRIARPPVSRTFLRRSQREEARLVEEATRAPQAPERAASRDDSSFERPSRTSTRTPSNPSTAVRRTSGVKLRPSTLRARLGESGDRWFAVLPRALRRERQSMPVFFERVAQSLLGPDLDAAVTYVAVKQALAQNGLADQLDPLLDALDARSREALYEGTLTPRALFDAAACKRQAMPSTSQKPIARLAAHFRRAGDSKAFALAHREMTSTERAALRAGMLSPADVVRLARSAQARDVDVVVIGAGAAGLAAAQEAMRQGLTCVVVEAQGAVGGRASVDEKTFSIPFDRGGAWVHTAAENPLRAVAEKLGFTLVRDEKQLLAYDGDNDPVEEGRALEHEVERLAAHWQSLAERGVDIAGSSARLDGGKWADVAASVLGPLEVAVDVDQVSTLDFGTIMGEEADCFVKEGLGSVIASLRHGVPLRLEAPASALAWGKDGVVVTAGGEEFRGKRAIVTTSVGVLAKDTIAFEPPLPKWKRKAFDNVAMGVFNKIAFEFKDNVFGDVPAGARVRRLEAPEQPMEFVVRPFGSNMAVAFVGGSFARQLEERGSAAAIEHGLEVLEKLYGSEVRAQVKAATTTAWGSDPHTEGSYSAAKPGQQHMRRVLGEPVADRIYFAGEACHEEWAEHMAGAYLSGREAAQAIARKLKPSETTSTPTSTD